VGDAQIIFELSGNHSFSVKVAIRRFEPAKGVKIVYEKPCRIDNMYENCKPGDFWTRFHRRLKFFARMPDIPVLVKVPSSLCEPGI
jgi:hypothetical protein